MFLSVPEDRIYFISRELKFLIKLFAISNLSCNSDVNTVKYNVLLTPSGYLIEIIKDTIYAYPLVYNVVLDDLAKSKYFNTPLLKKITEIKNKNVIITLYFILTFLLNKTINTVPIIKTRNKNISWARKNKRTGKYKTTRKN